MKRINIYIKEEAYDYIKKIAPDNHRSVSGEISFILENYVAQLQNLPQQPSMYIPTPVQMPMINTPENPTGQPIITAQTTTPTPDVSTMNGLELQEYARKLSAEAKTKITQEKAEARAEAKQLTPEEEQIKAQKQDLQKQKLQEKRDKAIRDKAIELDLENAENYDEEMMLFDYYGLDYIDSKYNGTRDKYANKPLEEVYKLMQEIKDYENKQAEEQKRRDSLPHDVDDWDYKSEDFLRELEAEEGKRPDTLKTDPDYLRLREYYISHCYYNRFLRLFRSPHFFSREFIPADMSYEAEYKAMQSAFNREKIDEDYIEMLLYGSGPQYREEHKCLSYTEEYENEMKEMEAIIKSKPKKTIIE